MNNEKIFKEVKNVFLKKFNSCCILYQKNLLKIGFDNRDDANWFEKNILPRQKESPVILENDPLKHIHIRDYKFGYSFQVTDKDKLIKLLNKR